VSDLTVRLTRVRDAVARAASRAGRPPSSVTLVAVSKTFPVDAVRALSALGQVDFGENKVQEGLAKQDAARAPSGPAGSSDELERRLRWHLIGHLQSNKAKKAVAFDVIHSIDSADLLTRVDEAARMAQRSVDVLIQVDLAGESTKFGALPTALPALLDAAGRCHSARLRGLMTLPPATDDPEDARRYFAALRELRDSHLGRVNDPGMLGQLSMGMSHDFEVAIEEGATMVRVGSAIFGERLYTK